MQARYLPLENGDCGSYPLAESVTKYHAYKDGILNRLSAGEYKLRALMIRLNQLSPLSPDDLVVGRYGFWSYRGREL